MYHRYMDPHTQPLNPQMPPNSYPCQYYTSNHPSGFGQMPCPNPAEHNSCCNYSHPPGYYSFGPQYACIQPSPPLHYHAPYPPHPYAYPAYSIPPPHYSLDQPRYDYDKTKHHCCGCPNHTCPQKDDKPDSSNLIRTPNYPFPVFWVPPEYTKDKENSNGWVPLDVNGLKGTRQEGQEKRQPTSPIIWMPGFDKPMEAAKDVKENSSKSVEDWPSNFRIVPLKLLEDEDGDKKSKVEEDATKTPKEKESRIKFVPLKLLENVDEDKKSSTEEDATKAPKEKESRIKIVPVKHLEEVNEKNSMPEKPTDEPEAKKTSDKKQTTMGKSSKLPPVCLRVDPLPRRKSANGASRSPSPPGAKGERAHQQDEGQISKVSADGIAKRNDIPVTAVKAKPSSQEEKEENCKSNEANLQAKEKMVDTVKHAATEGRREHVEGNRSEGENKERKELSQSDAAVVIQSAYRGFEVRRWQPLDKLRKIAKIREQTANIRGQIESSAAEKDAKQRIVIGETIMNLLLQLDTIQGLHPSVREARKAVARELVCLQEKLDALSSPGVEDHESAKVSDDRVLSETKPDSEQESLEETAASPGCGDTRELAKVEDNYNAVSTDFEGTLDSNLTEPTCDQGSKQLTEVNNDEDRTYDNKKSNMSSGDEVATIASPSLANVPVPEKESSMFSEDEVATIASPSLVTVPVSEKESSMPSDNEETNITSTVPVPEEESNMPSDNEVAIIASPSLVTVPLAEGKMDDVEDGNNAPAIKGSVEAVETAADVDESPLPSTEALIEGQTSYEPGKQQESTDASGTISDVSEHCEEHEAAKEEVADSGALDDTDKINHEMDNKPLELQKDADTEENQAIPMVDENRPIEISAEVEDVAGMGVDNSCLEHDVESDNHVATVTENPNVSVASDLVATTNEAEAPVVRGNAVDDVPVGVIVEEKKLIEENGKLREMLEQLLVAGKEQLGVISDLHGRVKDLERKLAQKKRMKVKRNKRNQRSVDKCISHQ